MSEPSKYPSKVRLRDFDSSKGLNRGASKLKEICWYLMKVIFFLSALPYPSTFKCFLLKLFGAKIGTRIYIKPRVNIHMPWKLEIGSDVWVGEEVFILNFEMVTIGNNVCISQRAFLCGGNHDFTDPAMRYRNGPITLMDGSWIGAGVFVGPNVTVGTDTVVAAGSVISSSLEDNSVFKGNPPVRFKSRWKEVN